LGKAILVTIEQEALQVPRTGLDTFKKTEIS